MDCDTMASASLRRTTALTGGVLAALLTVLPSPQPLHAQDATISTPQTGTNGAAGTAGGAPTNGGDGGAGYQYSQIGTVTVDATVTGGNGGDGGDNQMNGAGANGGLGGAGLLVTQPGGGVTVNAAVTGGRGGRGGSALVSFHGLVGDGGAGLVFTNGGTATINASVTGGSSGNGGLFTGTGGAGIVGGGLTLTLGSNANVAGGTLGSRGNAITFTGGANTLSIEAGATLTGDISLGTNTTTLQFAQTNDYTLNNVISGSGSVSKNGPGALYLTGTNTYTGGTRVDNGPLFIGDGGTSGSIVGDVVNNAALAFYRSDDTSFAGTISGTGVVYKAGAGTLTLTGVNTYIGGTTIREGTLSIAADANLGDPSAVLTIDGGRLATTASFNSARAVSLDAGNGMVVGGVLDTANATTLTLSGVISGAGALTKAGAGTLILSGTNTYSGGTIVSAGTLQIGNGGTTGSLTGDVVNNATLAFNRSDASVFAGAISGTGSVVKDGAGALTLTGVSTYSGATTVSAGRLAVNGSIASSSLTVNAGGTLGGSGTVGATSIAGGTLAPGNSIGTLSVNGNLAFNAASTYAVEVSPAASDRVNVTGTATLGGATVAASFAPGTYVARQYTILNATGGVSGTFGAKVDTNLPSGFKSSLGYDPNNAYLNLALDFTPTPAPTPAAPAPSRPVNQGLNRNQTAAANALTGYFNRTGGIPAVFGGLTPQGLSQVAGEPATGVQQTTTNVMTQFMGALTAIAPDGRGVPLAPAPAGFASYTASKGQAEDLPTRKGAPAPAITPDPDLWRWSVWAGGYGAAQFNGADAGAGTAATTSRIYGAMAGADYRISADTVAGFALGGGATSFNTFGLGSGSSDLFQAGAFIRQQFGRSYVTASAAYAWQDVTTDRSVAGLDRLQGRFNANTWSGRIEAGHRFGLASLGLTPYAAGQFSTVSLPGYRETALSGPGTFALSYAGKDTTRLRGELGLRADAQFTLAGRPLKLEAGAAWVRNGNVGSSALASFQTLPGATFSVVGTALDRNALRTTASAELSLGKSLTIATTLEGEFAQNSRSLGGKAALRYSW
ncbi:MAG: autotransporter domain-containing protein [Chelatococcus sp.]|nr:MAG: autotransporter domain-containing protein [Chelatococcus sp.]